MAESVRVSAVKRVLKISDTKIYSECVNQRGLRGEAGGGGRGGGIGRDEVWNRETMFSRLAKRSPCLVVSG